MKVTLNIKRNIIKIFKKIYARRVYYKNIYSKNILIRSDNLVVIINFERSKINMNLILLNNEIEEVKYLLVL
jgi:hypothetical protein